jgi:hypothetical protein
MNKYILSTVLDDSLQAKIVACVHENMSSNWNAYTGNYADLETPQEVSLSDRGRRANYTHLFPDLSNDVNKFGDAVLLDLKLDNQFIRPIPHVKTDNTQFLPHMISVVYKENHRSIGIRKHMDKRSPDGWLHLRFNFLVSGAEGGNPIINSEVLEVAEKQGWACFASEWKHGSLPVFDQRLRIVLSLGYFIEPSYAKNTFKNLLTNLNNNV